MRRLILALAVLALAWPPAQAWSVEIEQTSGFVQWVLPATFGTERAAVLFVASGFDAPTHVLILADGPNPGLWRRWEYQGKVTAVAVGDVNGDGHDDVAIADGGRGPRACTVAGTSVTTECGVVELLDGAALRAGRKEAFATLSIAPDAGCQPTTHVPWGLAIRDLNGDGKGELAIGQIDILAGSCGVVRVFDGTVLDGAVAIGEACAVFRGDIVPEGTTGDLFGHNLLIVPDIDGGGTGDLMASAYLDDTGPGPGTGRVLGLRMESHCGPSATTISRATPPSVAWQLKGTEAGDLLGIDMDWANGRLLLSAGKWLGVYEPGRTRAEPVLTPRVSLPLSVVPDLDGDGLDEILAADDVIEMDGTGVLNLSRAIRGPGSRPATFRDTNGVVISHDLIIMGSRINETIWTVRDPFIPAVRLQADRTVATVGDTVELNGTGSVALTTEVPAARWSAAGATIVRQEGLRATVRLDAPGDTIVQLELGQGRGVVRITAQPRGGELYVRGPAVAQLDEQVELTVLAPPAAAISWTSPGGTPASGDQAPIHITYATPGVHTVTVTAVLPNGTTLTRTHEVRVVGGALEADVQNEAHQADPVALRIPDPDPTLTYRWELAGLVAEGTNVTLPALGNGDVPVTVVAFNAAGEPVATARATVRVINAAPQLVQFQVTPGVRRVEATATAIDPGGDTVTLTWLVDGSPAGSGPRFHTVAEAGRLNVTVVARDSGGAEAQAWRAVNVLATPAPGPPSDHHHDDDADETGGRRIPAPAALLLVVPFLLRRRRNDGSL